MQQNARKIINIHKITEYRWILYKIDVYKFCILVFTKKIIEYTLKENIYTKRAYPSFEE